MDPSFFTSDNVSGDVTDPMKNVSNKNIIEEQHEPIVSDQQLQIVRIVFVMILISSVSIFGILGNIFCIIVLVQQRMRTATNYCLAALAFSDTLVLIHSSMFSILSILCSLDEIRGQNVRHQLYPIFGAYGSVVSARITTILTVLICVERFIAVYFPMKARYICSKMSTLISIIIVYIATITLLIPLALKYNTQTRTVGNVTLIAITKTKLGKHKVFYIIYGLVMNVLFRFLPIILLIIMNFLILRAIRKTWTIRRIMSNGSYQRNIQEQTKVTVMLLTVSTVFLVCITPGAINNIISQAWPVYSRIGKEKNLYLCISNVTYFLESLNSSVNFVIYMLMSRKFYLTYKEICWCIRANQRRLSDSIKLLPRMMRNVASASSLTSETRFTGGNQSVRLKWHKNSRESNSSFD